MKKIISVLLVIGMVFSFAACKKPNANKSLYDVYENISEQTDSGKFDVSFSVKIVDKDGELEDEEFGAFLEPYKSGKNKYELFVGLTGAYDKDSQKLAVSVGADAKNKDDVFEIINVEGDIYMNLKATYSFAYDLIKSTDALGELGIELPKWKDLGFSGDYLDLTAVTDAISEVLGLEGEDKLGPADLLDMFSGIFDIFGDDDYDYDYDYDYGYDYDFDFDYDYGYDLDEYAYDDAGAVTSIIEEFGAIFEEGLDWISDVQDAIPEKNLEALMDAFEAGLKDAGVVSVDGDWYTVTLDKNVRKIPGKLAKSLKGNVAENLKAIFDAVTDVDTVPEEIKSAFAMLDGLGDDDYEDLEDELIEDLEDLDLSDNVFTDGDLKIEAKIKTTKKSTAFKFSVDAKSEGSSISLELSANSSAESVKINAPTSLITKDDIFNMFSGLLGAFGLDEAA